MKNYIHILFAEAVGALAEYFNVLQATFEVLRSYRGRKKLRMDKTSIAHITLAGTIGALAAYFNILLAPLIMLTVVMAVDYLTGMFSASRTCEEASNRPRPAIWHEAAHKKLENEVT